MIIEGMYYNDEVIVRCPGRSHSDVNRPRVEEVFYGSIDFSESGQGHFRVDSITGQRCGI